MTFNSFPIPTKPGFESLLVEKAQDVATDADRAEVARDLSETYAGVVARATSVAGLTDPTTLTLGDLGYVSGSGDEDEDGLYEVQDNSGLLWVRIGASGLAGKLGRAEFLLRHQIVADIDDVDPEPGVVYLVPSEAPSASGLSSIVEITAGTPRATVQQALNDSVGRTVRLLAGTHRIGPIDVPEGVVLEVTPLAVLMWNLSASIVNEDAILRVRGVDSESLKRNVLIELLGEIDGDETGLSSLPTQLEGIDVKLTEGILLRGDGIIRNMREDGLDLDASRDVRVIGLTAINCGGWGLHHGGNPSEPADNIGNQSSTIIGFSAIGNGAAKERGGIDVNGLWGRVTLTSCVARDNYKNYDFAGGGATGRIVSACQSIDTGSVVAADTGLQNTAYCQINDRLFLGGVEITA